MAIFTSGASRRPRFLPDTVAGKLQAFVCQCDGLIMMGSPKTEGVPWRFQKLTFALIFLISHEEHILVCDIRNGFRFLMQR